MKLSFCLIAALVLTACAKSAPPPTSVARSLPGNVLFTVEVYDVPSGDEFVTGSFEVITAAEALNLRDRLEDVKAELRSSPRIATLFGKPAMITQSGQEAPGFSFRADASVDGDRLATRFSWLDLAPGDRPPASSPSMEGAMSWATTVARGSVVALRLPPAEDGTPRLALVLVEGQTAARAPTPP